MEVGYGTGCQSALYQARDPREFYQPDKRKVVPQHKPVSSDLWQNEDYQRDKQHGGADEDRRQKLRDFIEKFVVHLLSSSGLAPVPPRDFALFFTGASVQPGCEQAAN